MSKSFRSALAKYRSRRLFAVWLIGSVGTAAFLALALFSLRIEALRTGERYARSLTRLASEQTSRSFQTVGQALALAEADLAGLADDGRLTEAAARTALAAQLHYLPYTRALWFMDSQGVIRYDSDVGNIGVSLQDRDYFQAHLNGRDALYVGEPVRSRSVGTWLISASRAVRRPDGSIEGVYAAAIEPPYFDKLWRSVELGTGGVVALFSQEGVLMLRSPWVDEAVGRSFAQGWPFAGGLVSSQSTAVIKSRIDGRLRLMSYQRLDDFPNLVLTVGIDYGSVFQAWQRFAIIGVVIWLFAMAVLTLLLVSWSRDARRRHEAEQRSARAHRLEAIGTLAGGVAHDFNNVIGALLGNARIARQQLDSENPAQEALRRIEVSGLRARALVQQILAFSRGEPEARTQIDLRPLIEETIGLLRATLPGRIRLVTRLSAQPLVVHADPGQIQQVVMNLCTNAWQAIDEGPGSIEIGLDQSSAASREAALGGPDLDGLHAHIWVRDSGRGIPPQTLDRIFQPFFTTKPKGVGTGLGLSVVHGLVTAHGGSVLARSTPGIGSTFHVFLPLSDTALADAAPARDDEPAVDGQGLRVLCVDDDEVILVMLQAILSAQHFDVVSAHSPEEALARLPTLQPALAAVVTDYDMPSISGVELARRLREVAPGLPVLLMSGFIDEQIEAAARAAGIVELVQKERAYAELAAAILRAHRGGDQGARAEQS